MRQTRASAKRQEPTGIQSDRAAFAKPEEAENGRGQWLTGIDHYENFPVASRLMPARLRPPVIAIYRFARYADDVADEGNASKDERLAELNSLRTALNAGGNGQHPVVRQLFPHLVEQQIPLEPLLALLSAFEQDVTVTRYQTERDVLDYCARSADPVGQLILHLFGVKDPQSIVCSNAICSALQLINFVQDFAIDWQRGRLYMPLSQLEQFGLTTTDLDRAVSNGRASAAIRALIESEGRRAGALLESGAPLLGRVPLRLALELRAIMAGASRILEQLAGNGWDSIASRPHLTWRDAPALLRLMMTRNTPR